MTRPHPLTAMSERQWDLAWQQQQRVLKSLPGGRGTWLPNVVEARPWGALRWTSGRPDYAASSGQAVAETFAVLRPDVVDAAVRDAVVEALTDRPVATRVAGVGVGEHQVRAATLGCRRWVDSHRRRGGHGRSRMAGGSRRRRARRNSRRCRRWSRRQSPAGPPARRRAGRIATTSGQSPDGTRHRTGPDWSKRPRCWRSWPSATTQRPMARARKRCRVPCGRQPGCCSDRRTIPASRCWPTVCSGWSELGARNA